MTIANIAAVGRTKGGLRRPGEFAGLRVHLVGIGGCGMFGAARILLRSGAKVSGSDVNKFSGTGELVAGGATVHIGHAGDQVGGDVELLVCSAAIAEDNPEILAARAKSIPIIRYAELLGEIMASRAGVSVAGTHGKSTTTGLVAHLFRTAGLDPSFIVGAQSDQLGGSSGVGAGPHFIVESCEYARSFLNMRPSSAAILNVDTDHLDCYRDLEDIVAAFNAFARRIPAGGLLVVNHDDRNAKRAGRDVACRVESFGFGPGADWRAVNLRARQGRYAFMVLYRGVPFVRTALCLAGEHNVANALAAAALAHSAGCSAQDISAGLSTFTGVKRRMTYRGCGRGVTIIDDYAHHPTEIRATVKALKDRYSPKRTWVVFQPHQASRTRHLFEEFGSAFDLADEVLLPDIYSVRDSEEDRLAVGSSRLAERISSTGKHSLYLPSMEAVTDHLERNTAAGDLVIVMGAGDIYKVADELVARMC